MSVIQCRECGHRVAALQKKCSICGSAYPAIKRDAIAVFSILSIIIIAFGIYLTIYFSG